MQDRPDLIQSELAGLAFDSLQQVFRKSDVEIAFSIEAIPATLDTTVWLVIDPAAGGPQSDYAVVSIYRSRGTVTVGGACYAITYSSSHTSTKSESVCVSLDRKLLTASCLRSIKKRTIFRAFRVSSVWRISSFIM